MATQYIVTGVAPECSCEAMGRAQFPALTATGGSLLALQCVSSHLLEGSFGLDAFSSDKDPVVSELQAIDDGAAKL